MTRFHTSPIVWMAVLAAALGLSAATAAPATAATTYTLTVSARSGSGSATGTRSTPPARRPGPRSCRRPTPSPARIRTGQIAGMCQDTSGNGHLVLWQNGTVTDLGSIGNISDYGLAYVAVALNNNGQIAVWTQATPDGYLYSNGTVTDLGSFYPNSINDNGVMVGGPSIDSGGTVQNLNSLIPANSASQAGDATAINDNGQIVAITPDDHTLLLNPS